MQFAAVHESQSGPSRTSSDVRPESAKWAKPDIDQVCNLMSTRPNENSNGAPKGGRVHKTHCLVLFGDGYDFLDDGFIHRL
jgi:hypothetical protein